MAKSRYVKSVESKDVATSPAEPKARSKPGPKPKPEGERRSEAIQVRMPRAYKAWLDEYAADTGRAVSDLIDLALVEFARRERRQGPPPR